jgi:hypothetical protein
LNKLFFFDRWTEERIGMTMKFKMKDEQILKQYVGDENNLLTLQSIHCKSYSYSLKFLCVVESNLFLTQILFWENHAILFYTAICEWTNKLVLWKWKTIPFVNISLSNFDKRNFFPNTHQREHNIWRIQAAQHRGSLQHTHQQFQCVIHFCFDFHRKVDNKRSSSFETCESNNSRFEKPELCDIEMGDHFQHLREPEYIQNEKITNRKNSKQQTSKFTVQPLWSRSVERICKLSAKRKLQ